MALNSLVLLWQRYAAAIVMNAKTPTASCWSAGTSWWMAAPQAAASRVRTASSITAQSGRGGSGSRCKPRFLREQCVRATRLLAPGCTNAGKIQPKPRRDAIEMTRRGRVFEKIVVLRAIHSSDSSNGDASRHQSRRIARQPIRRGQSWAASQNAGTARRRRAGGSSAHDSSQFRRLPPNFRAMATAR